MDYAKLVHQLTAEMKKGVQYARIPKPFKLFAIIGMIPLIIAFVLSKIGYAITVFFYKMIAAPAEYLHHWLRSQKDEVHHATQAVMYFLCLPFIFSLQITLSLSAVSFFFQWFFLMIQGYLLTLGGIRWQPYITEAKFDEDETEYELKPETTAASVFACIIGGVFALNALVWFIGLIAGGGFKVFMMGLFVFLAIVHAIMIYIVNPCLFKRIPKK